MPAPIIRELETWADAELAQAKADLEAIWQTIEPSVLALGKTVLSQILAAAQTFVTSGGNAGDFVASIVAQLPSDIGSAEAIVASAFGMMSANLQATAAPVGS